MTFNTQHFELRLQKRDELRTQGLILFRGSLEFNKSNGSREKVFDMSFRAKLEEIYEKT